MRIQCCTRFFTSLPPLTPQKPPSPSEIHLWYIIPDELRCKTLFDQYLQILPPCEKEEVSRMNDEELMKRALLARVLVRTTIARYQVNSQPLVSPRSLKFRKNAHGKPEVHWQQNGPYHLPLQFNISHTSSLIACGVTTSGPIGIDVEEKQRVTKHNVLSFARRFFSDHEVQFLSSIEDSIIQQREFIKLWTLKEAYVKALGKGFSGAPFKSFTISSKYLLNGSLPLLKDPGFEASDIKLQPADEFVDDNTIWEFIPFELASTHYAAICTGHDSTRGKRSKSMELRVWKTMPFLEDQYIFG